MQEDNRPDNNESYTGQLPTIEPIVWSATESVAQQRGRQWYITATVIFSAILLVDVLLFIFGVFDLFTLITSGILIVAMFAALIISTRIPSRESHYSLSDKGIEINGVMHPMKEFRAFGVRQHGALWQLVLIPVKRFGFETAIFIDENNGEQIVDLLAGYLPMEEVPENGVDKIIDRLKMN